MKKGSVGLRYFSFDPCRNGLIGSIRIPSTSKCVTNKKPATVQTVIATRLQIRRQRSSSRWSRNGISPAGVLANFGIVLKAIAHSGIPQLPFQAETPRNREKERRAPLRRSLFFSASL